MMRKVSTIAALLYGACSGHGTLTAATSVLNHRKPSVGKEFDGYRIWATGDMLDDGVYWVVKDLKLYGSLNCTGTNYNDGTLVDSGHASSDDLKRVFGANGVSSWQGILNDENGERWVGMVYDSPIEVMCLSYLDLDRYGVNKFKIEARESLSSIWREIIIVEMHQSGQRHDIPLSSISPYQPIASSIYCDDNRIPITVQISLMLDGCPSETSWNVTNIFTNHTVSEGGSYNSTDIGGVLNTTFSVCPQDCFRFTIYDTFGDGLTGGYYCGNPGSYQFFYSGDLVQEGDGNFRDSETSKLFGAGCPSIEPSTSYVPTFSTKPSDAPSLSTEPSPIASFTPTSIPSYPPSLSSAPSSAPSPGPSSNPTSAPSMSSPPSTKPSSAPFSAPSNAPSSAPLIPLCATSSPCTGVLTFYGSNPSCLLPQCAGHCDADSDCAADLYCLRREGARENDSIPGCESVPYGAINYCVAREFQPSGAPSRIPTTKPSHSPTRMMAPNESSAWTQFGNAIDTNYSYFAMAADRLIVAVREGQFVLIYRLDKGSVSWTPIADAIDPQFTSIDDYFYRLALSSDGSVVAINDEAHDSYTGRVQIFAEHPVEGWIQLGSAIAGIRGNRAWDSLALSADGTVVAIAAYENDNNNYGYVRMFAYGILSKDWLQQGDAINGKVRQDHSGTAIDISADGSVVAIGAGLNDGNGKNSGHVRVFEFKVQDEKWVQRGGDLNGEASDDFAGGNSIAISRDGSVIAIGAIGNGERAGRVRVFEYNATDEDWGQRGGDIDGEAEKDRSGYSVDTSADGTTIVIGAPFNSGNGKDAGHLRVYDFSILDDLWIQRGVNLDGENPEDRLGENVAISSDGKVVGSNGFNTASLRVMKWTSSMSSPSSMPSSTPSCANDKVLLHLDITTDRFPKQTTWDVRNISNETILSGGPYDEMFTLHSEAYCLDQGCYHFTIQDLSSDGICCDWFVGNSKYKLYFDSALVQEGGNFTSEEVSIPIGRMCPSPSPSRVPSSKPSLQPTLSTQPSEFPSTGPSSQPSLGPTISLQPSNIPSNKPTDTCPVGTFVDNTTFDCEPCPPGTYQDKARYSDSCKECDAGSSQPDAGQSKCIICKSGTFQDATGQAQCKECRAGGYCSAKMAGTCDGGFKPCPIGTFNNVTGATTDTSCLPCPTGTFSDNKEGLVQCLQCPYRLSSEPNSSVCSFCAKDFYLSMVTVDPGELNKEPGAFCLACPINVNCDKNTTINTLKGDTNFWRISLDTQKYYACENSNGCQGNNSCAEGYKGILCELCVDERKYVNDNDGTCTECPHPSKLLMLPFIVVLAAAVTFAVHTGTQEFPVFKHYIGKLLTYLTRIRMQAKLKMIISFYQVVNTFTPIYGVRMHSTFTSWFSFLQVVNFGFSELFAIPGHCIGSMRIRLLITATWPYALIILLVGVILLYSFLQSEGLDRGEFKAKFWSRSLYATIVILYLVLPSISRNIFDAKTCKSFTSSDVYGLSTSHLLADWSLKCDKADKAYGSVLRAFWAVFVFWPVGVPLLFLVLLLYICASMRYKRITPLAEACRFLWGDYKDSMILWEFVDVVRKISLTGLIIFIDTEEGSEKTLRLHIGAVMCILYTGVLALARPYRHNDDLYIGVITNMLLASCFVVGVMIHQCNEDNDVKYNTCKQMFGLSLNPYRATAFAVILTASVLLVSIASVLFLAVIAVFAPAVYLVSTNGTPRLDMPKGCTHHMFVSHVWSTGQDKVHKIVRMLQQYVPELSIWLDVDALDNLNHLEDSVSDAAHFVLFYSKGFFASPNCCREVIKAMKEDKPITVLYEVDDNTAYDVNEMKKECTFFWPVESNVDDVVKYIFAEEPILWVSTGILFSLESIKLVVGRLLETLPYYKKNSDLLDAGLRIDGEVGSVEVLSSIELMHCSASTRSYSITQKLKEEHEAHLSASLINVSMPHLNPEISARMVDLTSLYTKRNNTRQVVLLYLNEDTFKHPDDPAGLECEIIKRAIDENIQVILVHEKDLNEGGCPFSEIIAQTPQELKESPYKLYSQNMAVNLYHREEYQRVSLRQILFKITARPIDM